MTPVLELDRLTKRFGEFTAVDDVSLRADAGEVVGLIGANGSGKTTTMRMALGLIHPTDGRARIGGAPSTDPEARRRVGYLPDDPPLEDRWTIEEQLDWWEALRGPATQRAEIEDRIGIDRSKRIGELSRGNRQKAAIVMALMHDPALLVLDEPATGLDPLVRRDLWHTLRATAAAGTTVFLSSHVLADVEHACDRVVVLRDGAAVYDGSVEALLRDAARTVEIEFAAPVDPHEFARLEVVDSASVAGRRMTMTVNGSIDPIVKAAAKHDVVDFTTSQPTLEGSFADLNEAPR